MVAAALAQKSVHWEESSFAAYSGYESSVDVTADSGAGQIIYPCCTRHNSATVQILLVNYTVYVRGDAAGLHITLGYHPWMTKAKATKYAGQWIAIPRGDKLYAGIARRLTLVSIIHRFTPRAGRFGKLTMTSAGPTGANGPTGPQGPTGAAVLAGPQEPGYPALLAGPTGAMTVRTRGEPLPVTFSELCYFCEHEGTFSRWNEPVPVEPPARSTPIATVRR